MQVCEGEGWRLCVQPQRVPYAALIGADDWAVELELQELACLRRAVLTLLGQHRSLVPCLMAEEEVELELELPLSGVGDGPGEPAGGTLFVALCGLAERWSLRFVLTPAAGRRGVEGAWTEAASPALAAALEGLGDGLAGDG